MLFAVPDGYGAIRMMYFYALALKQNGFEVDIVHGDSTAVSDELPQTAQSMLDELVSKGVRCIPVKGYLKQYSFSLAKRIDSLVREKDYSIVIGYNQRDFKYALKVAAKYKKLCVLAIQNKQGFWGGKFSQWVKSKVFRYLIRRSAPLLVCNSETIRDQMVDEYGASPSKCSVIPSAIPIPIDLPGSETADAIRRTLSVEPNQKLLVNTGRIDIQKGQDLLLQALEIVKQKDWVVVFVGSLSEGRQAGEQFAFENSLHALVEKNNWKAKVHFVGYRTDVSSFLAAGDLYVHAARWEGPAAPLAILEAMAANMPVVMTDCSGYPIGFKVGIHGYVAKSENPKSIAEQIELALELSNEKRKEMGVLGRQLVIEHYDINKIAQDFVDEVKKHVTT